MNDARHPVMLVILDGWGLRDDKADNAVKLARTPNYDRLIAGSPQAKLSPSGRDVGLPPGQMGNSEVGHLNIGAGRVVMQDLPRITEAAESGALAHLPPLKILVDALKSSGGRCHLLGLVSPGGVHSHQDHAVALAKALTEAGVPVDIHVITDGRDTPPQAGVGYVKSFLAALPPGVRVATVCGRYFAMDRDNRWERVAKAYETIVAGQGDRAHDPLAVLQHAYATSKGGDEFVPPTAIGEYSGMQDGDGLICFNFRADRVREFLMALLDRDFTAFTPSRRPQLAAAVGMTSYSTELDKHLATLFPPQDLTKVLGEVVAAAGRTQVRMAESEKYPHVTYFLNGGREEPYAGEDRIMVPSPKVATYDMQPEMSAPELTDKAVAAIRSGKYDMIVLNFANPDMVGHTGDLQAVIKAVETVDAGLGRIADAIEAMSGALLVTADHGNCELMKDPSTGGPHTAHTTNPVPVFLVGRKGATLRDGRLADLAPTLLALLGIAQPPEMTGCPLTDAA
ncbi:2,3-bisphosphoglycerate-independent phosphoglycerate mutase [Hyphomicrobiales bacterium BP6-180914]|uniref:2,3-bisphosphoglycerate-independent phosphoglycerate mutase n=2 Tax=Lichenifustis flavocetrariae TaxID=2949735 RepID=A0AA41YVG5_9HYPH|nr:2,3-bisphosphoglycerate-independent phosphoglycerate mutase [Lichenifustis flavocetrariae]MCW6507867.1 2,3-bisphosphoglycerate-independent phosphoglycerate mutase [Lichenifustis flavocetrariae]